MSETAVPNGFLFASTTAGIKASGRPDLAMIEAPDGATAAAMFTRNRVVAAPVEVGREHLAASGGRLRAIIVNSGNANCATGAAGRKAAEATCSALARELGDSRQWIIPSSTGIIGVPLPVEKILAAMPALLHSRAKGEDGAKSFAHTILTTDTRPKTASVEIRLRGKNVRLLGICKGAGMIHPQMATMLVYLLTDIGATPAQLRAVLKSAVDESFHCISVDGDTSTNDTVLLAASGVSGITLSDARARHLFQKALSYVCWSLSQQIIEDGEGVEHVVELQIEQARTRDEALTAARTIAHSLLVKTAWAGADPNWGRVLAAVGRSGLKVNPASVNIFINTHQVCRGGTNTPFDQTAAHREMTQRHFTVRVQLGMGKAAVRFLTTDLTAEYVRVNAEYST